MPDQRILHKWNFISEGITWHWKLLVLIPTSRGEGENALKS